MTADFLVPKRKFAAAALLTSGTLAWFFLMQRYIHDIFLSLTQNELWAYSIGTALFYGSAILFAIIGAFISGRVNRRNLLISWISLGIFSTILLAIFQGEIFATVASILLGISLGLGLPSCMALIADFTSIEERARVSGFIILGTFIMAFITMIAASVLNLGIIGTILLFAVVRSVSFLALLLDRCDKCDTQQQSIPQEPSLQRPSYKEFGYYLFPWVLFAIASGLAWNLIPIELEAAQNMGTMLRYVSIAVFGFVAGVSADKFGRKQPIILSLIVLGVSYALLGFLGINGITVILYLAISGISWGSLLVVFLAVPGDLAGSNTREKFYGLMYILPVAVLFGLSSIPGTSIFAHFSPSQFSQILSVMLFLSIIPVLRARETLPKEKIRERKMKEYLSKIGKIVQDSKESDTEEIDE